MQSEELGFNGLTHFGGTISNEINTNLRGTEAVKTYRKMADSNATVGSLIHTITTLIQQASAEVIAHEDDTEEKQADFLRDNLDNLETPFKSVIANALTEIIYGWSISELVYENLEEFLKAVNKSR